MRFEKYWENIELLSAEMEQAWLSDDEWSFVQARVPIVCIDVLPVQINGIGRRQIGLVLRETPHQGQRWCLIGGRLMRNETQRAGLLRQVAATLGPSVECLIGPTIRPVYVAEYLSVQRSDMLFDPRQHALGITFAVRICGIPTAIGEAIKFEWFDTTSPPSDSCFGFGQADVVRACFENPDIERVFER